MLAALIKAITSLLPDSAHQQEDDGSLMASGRVQDASRGFAMTTASQMLVSWPE